MKRVAAIVLAAGESRRMGESNKLLIDYRGKPLLHWVLDALRPCELFQTVVVTGHEAEALRASLAGRALEFAHAPDYAGGMSASIRVGVAALRPECDAVFICVGDTPGVRSDDIRALLDAYEQGDADSVLAPFFEGRRGHPVLWPRRYFERLSALRGDQGARSVLEDPQVQCVAVPVDHSGVVRDVDRPEDLRV